MSLGRIIDDFVELFRQPLPLGAGVKMVSIMITLGAGAFVFQTIRQKIIEKKGLQQKSDPKELESIIDKIIFENKDKVTQYKSGKDKLFGFFVGQVMKASEGKANPQLVNEILKQKLK